MSDQPTTLYRASYPFPHEELMECSKDRDREDVIWSWLEKVEPTDRYQEPIIDLFNDAGVMGDYGGLTGDEVIELVEHVLDVLVAGVPE